MNAGRLLRLGTPHELLTDPGDDFVAALMSSPKRQADQLKSLVVHCAKAVSEPDA
jgi:ABC-type proline/glycine betaine transport system ATPase subunit